MRWKILLLFAGLVLGTAANSAFAAEDAYADVHTAAVVSAIGDYAAMKEQTDISGAFQSNSAIVDISDRDIDGAIQKQIESVVGSRFQVAKPSYNRGAFLNANPQSATDNYDETLKALLQAQPPMQDVDAVIVVHRDYNSVDGRLDGPWLKGLGVLKVKMMFGAISSTSAYASYAISVIDTKTGEILGDGRATIGEGWLNQSLPRMTVDDDEWTSAMNGLPLASKTQLEDEFQKLIFDSLPSALRGAKLISDAGDQSTAKFNTTHP